MPEQKTTTRNPAIEAAQAQQAQLDELEKARARARELETELGITATGGAHGGGVRGDVQALLRERAGYLRRAHNPAETDRMTDRVAQVDEQLRLRGYRVNEKTLDKDTAEAVAAAGPGVRVEDAIVAREAQQTVR